MHCQRARLLLDCQKPRAEPNVDPAPAVLAIEEGSDLSTGDALHDAGFRLKHRDIAALGAHRGGDFEPDIPAADDGDATRIVERGPQPPHVLDLSQREDVREVDARQRQRTRPRSGREYQRAVADLRSVAQRKPALPRIDLADRGPEHETHVVIAPEALRAQRKRFRRPAVAEKLLGQGRPLIGKVRLVADHADGAGKSALAQAGGELSRGLAGTDDDNVLVHGVLAVRRVSAGVQAGSIDFIAGLLEFVLSKCSEKLF